MVKTTVPATPTAGLPKITYKDRYTLKAGAHTLALNHPARPAHTDGDTWVKVTDANIIFTGDLYFNGLYPFLDYSTGGNIDGNIAAIDTILKNSDGKTKFVPGHGDVSSQKELKAYRAMLAGISKNVHALIARGKTEEQAVAAKPTAAYDAVWGKGMLDGDTFTRFVYRGLKK